MLERFRSGGDQGCQCGEQRQSSGVRQKVGTKERARREVVVDDHHDRQRSDRTGPDSRNEREASEAFAQHAQSCEQGPPGMGSSRYQRLAASLIESGRKLRGQRGAAMQAEFAANHIP